MKEEKGRRGGGRKKGGGEAGLRPLGSCRERDDLEGPADFAGREPSTLPAVASLHRKRKPRPSLKQNCPWLTRVCSLRRDSTGC